MSKLAIWAELEAKPGKEEEVANFLKSAQPLAEKEPGTITWYAIKMGGPKFGIFDTFADEKGREAHLTRGNRESTIRQGAGIVCEGASNS